MYLEEIVESAGLTGVHQSVCLDEFVSILL